MCIQLVFIIYNYRENSFATTVENDFNPTLSILLADFFVRNASQSMFCYTTLYFYYFK